jgi:hypothetical protein
MFFVIYGLKSPFCEMSRKDTIFNGHGQAEILTNTAVCQILSPQNQLIKRFLTGFDYDLNHAIPSKS